MRILSRLSAPIIALAVAAFLIATYHIAYAQALNPDEDPVGTASLVYRLWKGGALLPAILVAAFGVLVILSRRVRWLQQGKRGVYVAGAVAGLALLAEPASRGTTPNLSMVVAAIGAFIALVVPPTKPTEAK